MDVSHEQMEAASRTEQFVSILGNHPVLDSSVKQRLYDLADTEGLGGPNVAATHQAIFDGVTEFVYRLGSSPRHDLRDLNTELTCIRRIADAVFAFRGDHPTAKMAWASILAVGILHWLAPQVVDSLFDEDEAPENEHRGGGDWGMVEDNPAPTPGVVRILLASQREVDDYIGRLYDFYNSVVV